MGYLDILGNLATSAYNQSIGNGPFEYYLGMPQDLNQALSGLMNQARMYPGLAQASHSEPYNRELYNPYAYDLHPDDYERQEWDNKFITYKRLTKIYNYNDLNSELGCLKLTKESATI